MHARVVYESLFGSTAEFAEAVAAGLRASGTVEVMNVVAAGEQPEPTVDLLVVGARTHLFGMSGTRERRIATHRTSAPIVIDLGIREWLANAHAPAPGTRAAAFETRVVHLLPPPGSAAHSIGKQLRRLGYQLVGDPAEFLVYNVLGPASTKELKRAKAWGERIGRTEVDRQAHPL
ncbi:hypothetical protein OG225_18100 [Nocardia sp. NBC_01377]|uniref:hypothetical protein n=1 Tax=Nocardia sp. NBC_01377 TaxID=2903595 RepID=UPI00325506EA